MSTPILHIVPIVILLLPFLSSTVPSSQNTKLSHPLYLSMPWSWANTEYSIHWVQHTPRSASTHDCLSSFHSHNYELTPECSFSFRCASLQDQPALHESSKVQIPRPHSHGCELTNWWIESQHQACLASTTSHRPPLIGRLQVHLRSHSIMASMSIANLARLHPPSASPNPLDYGLQVRLRGHSISASKCISKLARSWDPSPSPNPLYLALQVTLSSHNHGLQVYLWVHLIVIFRRTSNCSQPPPAASRDILYVDRYIDVYMRIQTEYMNFKIRWTISTSYDFQAP